MIRRLLVQAQQFLPQILISTLAGKLAEIKTPAFKNLFIQQFIANYRVNMQEALIEDPKAYASFNEFFIRQLKPSLRPIANEPSAIASPVDGTIAEIGHIQNNQLLQAKGMYFSLEGLLGNDAELSQTFLNGSYSTLYLAPHNYHRVHMPIAGKLQKMLYVPGKLFSVNRMTSELIPNIFSRNERLITIFETPAGKVAVIFVGALIVGSIQTSWMTQAIRASHSFEVPIKSDIQLNKGEELGYFKLGSTVILLFENNRIHWNPACAAAMPICFGQKLGEIVIKE